MLVTGIMEMKHADIYIDVTEFTDEEILEHPVFIHNFVMCILSIFVMTIYLIQAWLLLDQWMWIIQEEDDKSSISEKKSDSDDLDHKPTIYCCFVDWYNYGKLKAQSKSKHEFQVVHIL
ncbi:uncharacterized protein LOC105274999 isoform X2 [Ooceraea biroi]|uniref:uncharacterized protein LOC105274999 isoform X2 n=1 Tax=Ooceraea biroi TaxID=2015173 RepID=UPI000F078747|nr:uncharacterized protein LOC105274999 isoform X2 [Ooceraea biroi]